MKNRIRAGAAIVLLLSLSACGGVEVNVEPTPTPEVVKMTQAQYDKAAEDLDAFVFRVLAFSEDVASTLLNVGVTTLIDEESETINLSLVPQYIAAKNELAQTVKDIRAYDTSKLSEELQKCFSKLLEYAEKMEYYSNAMSNDLTVDELEELTTVNFSGDQSEYIDELGELFIAAGAAMDKQMGIENSSTGNQTSTFTNKYGTPTTRCAHSGCTNYIASSGDTNCCTVHSNKCLNCGKYIDEDAMYCMDCVRGALKK